MLETERLLLREFTPDDFEAVFAYLSDPEVMRWIIGEPLTEAETREFFRRVDAYTRETPRAKYRLAVVLKAENRVIGSCGIDIMNAEQREGEIGYRLHRAYWGQGYTPEAARRMLQYGFETMGLHRIYADCYAANRASARVMEKIGMQREAHFRECIWLHGAWQDRLLYAILDHEWQAQQLSSGGHS